MGLLDKFKKSRGVGFRFNVRRKRMQLKERAARIKEKETELKLIQRERRLLEEEAKYRKAKEKVKHLKRKSSLIWGIASGIGKRFEESTKEHRRQQKGAKTRSHLLFENSLPKTSLYEPYPYLKEKRKKRR